GADLGLHKAIVLVHRINLFYGVRWQAQPARAEDSPRRGVPDLLLTCVDSAPARLAVASWTRTEYSPTLWLDCGNGALQGQVVLGHLGGERSALPSRLPNVLDLFPELRGMKDDDTPSCSTAQALRKQALPVNRVAATIALDLLYSLFRFGRLEHHGAQFSVDPLRVTPIPIDPSAWELYGYRTAAPEPVAPARKGRRR
ncbi:MAG: PRTRC system ThiF family protein, partial [Thermoanaerobaculia bacterium]|nr:PRTRC system ThiF family protein [Thermoanaerobaculia bacterium]